MPNVTKAQLWDMVSEMEKDLAGERKTITELKAQIADLELQVEHFEGEASRLSKRCHRLEGDVEKAHEKHGDLIVTAQQTIASTVEIMRTTRPRLERQSWMNRHIAAQKTDPNEVEPYSNMPF